MKIILKKTISSLGIIGSEVTVADGYARNYLFPQGMAIAATARNLNIMKQQKGKLELQITKEKEFAQEMAEKIKQIKCTIKSKVHEENKLYGSVGIRKIIDTLNKQNIEIEKRMILLEEPIKTTGIFKIPVRVYTEIESEITVEVIPDNT